ncbi:hypothetical protein BpHYR1_024938 [Brachionus plicatilis]|uniref:Uncharacterized protein n=1 Tax=Brachionus plicatilis TaxID=10195 RepID=A0A3M7PPJ9_BRAPC|nr:hypothetical protein BpHYR1_024938 [Brachionus plicatilis]
MPPTILTLGILNETPHSSHEDLTNPLEQLRILFVEIVVLVLKCSVTPLFLNKINKCVFKLDRIATLGELLKKIIVRFIIPPTLMLCDENQSFYIKLNVAFLNRYSRCHDTAKTIAAIETKLRINAIIQPLIIRIVYLGSYPPILFWVLNIDCCLGPRWIRSLNNKLQNYPIFFYEIKSNRNKNGLIYKNLTVLDSLSKLEKIQSRILQGKF